MLCSLFLWGLRCHPVWTDLWTALDGLTGVIIQGYRWGWIFLTSSRVILGKVAHCVCIASDDKWQQMSVLCCVLSGCGVTTARKHWKMHTCVSSTPRRRERRYWRTSYFQVNRFSSVLVTLLQVIVKTSDWMNELFCVSGIGAFTIVDGHTVTGEDVGNK